MMVIVITFSLNGNDEPVVKPDADPCALHADKRHLLTGTDLLIFPLLIDIATAHRVCEAGSMKCQTPDCPSVHPIDRQQHQRVAGLLLSTL